MSAELRLFDPPASARCPKGARVGDTVIAERSRWQVQSIDHDRVELVCRLEAGARSLRRFRARHRPRRSRRRSAMSMPALRLCRCERPIVGASLDAPSCLKCGHRPSHPAARRAR
jgi:hypothetical protein